MSLDESLTVTFRKVRGVENLDISRRFGTAGQLVEAHPLHSVTMATDYRTTGCGANLLFISLQHVALLKFSTMQLDVHRLERATAYRGLSRASVKDRRERGQKRHRQRSASEIL